MALQFSRETEAQIDDLFVSYDRPDSPGCAVGVVHGDDLIYAKGFGQATLEHPSPITSQTVFDVGSMAKQFTEMAVALLAEEGQLQISDEIHAYLPEFPDCARGVTVAHLLYHMSGIRNYTVLAYYMMEYHESDAITSEELYELLLRQSSLSHEPGEHWEYSDSNYFLLAQIVERVTGQTLSQFAHTTVFGPLTMGNTLFRERHSQIVPHRATSYVSHPVAFRSPCAYRQNRLLPEAYHTLGSNYEHVGAEGLFTTVEDMVKWSRNFLDNRLGAGRAGLIDRMLTPGKLCNGTLTGYGYGLNVGIILGERYFGHSGAIHEYTSSMRHFPERDATILCLANHNTVGSWVYRDHIAELIFPDTVSMAVVNSPSYCVVADEVLRSIVGAYQNPETTSIWEITELDGALAVQVNRSWEFRLIPAGPLKFESTQPDMSMLLRFVPHATGQIQEIQGLSGEHTFTLLPFLNSPPGPDEFAEYAGNFHCEELQTTYAVDIVEGKLRLRNTNRHCCSMDLVYEPTIRDSFIAYDPHPVSSQITFLRDDAQITAFVYRDYDGDHREDLRFLKRRIKAQHPKFTERDS